MLRSNDMSTVDEPVSIVCYIYYRGQAAAHTQLNSSAGRLIEWIKITGRSGVVLDAFRSSIFDMLLRLEMGR